VLKAGARTFLQKPVANERLLAVIRLLLTEQDRPRAVVYDLAGPDSGLSPLD
jgi:FixJ family two-component response regulator